MWLGTRLHLVLRCRAGTGQAAAPGHLQIPPWPLHPPALLQSHPTCGFWGPTRCAPHTPGPAAPFLVLTAPAPALLVAADEGVAKQHQDQQGQPQAQDEPEHTDGLLPCKPEGEGALQTPAGGWGLRASPGEHGAAVGLCHPSPRLRGSPRLSSLGHGDMEQLASPRALHGDLLLPPHPLLPRAGKGAEGGVWVTRQDGEAVSRSPRSPAARLLLFRPRQDLTEPPSAFWPQKPALWGRHRGASPPRSHPRCSGEKPLSGGARPRTSPLVLGTKEAVPGGAGLLPPAPCRFPAAQLPPEDAAVPAGRGPRTSPGGCCPPQLPGGVSRPLLPQIPAKCPHGAFLAVPAGSG